MQRTTVNKEINSVIMGLREYNDSFHHYAIQFRTEESSPSMLSVKPPAQPALATQFAWGEITYNMKATQTTKMGDDDGSGTRNQVTRVTSRWLKTLWTPCSRGQPKKISRWHSKTFGICVSHGEKKKKTSFILNSNFSHTLLVLNCSDKFNNWWMKFTLQKTRK